MVDVGFWATGVLEVTTAFNMPVNIRGEKTPVKSSV